MMRPRRLKIGDMIENIARLRAMRAFADENPIFSDAERKSFDDNIKASRRAIVDLLEVPELRDLKAKGLQPEDALQILRDEPKPAILDKTISAALHKNYVDDLASRQFFLASKEFLKSFEPNVRNITDDDIGRGKIERFVFQQNAKAATASIADAYNNHVSRRTEP